MIGECPDQTGSLFEAVFDLEASFSRQIVAFCSLPTQATILSPALL
jgi:hypothetical protein